MARIYRLIRIVVKTLIFLSDEIAVIENPQKQSMDNTMEFTNRSTASVGHRYLITLHSLKCQRTCVEMSMQTFQDSVSSHSLCCVY